ncbi:molybdenum cofactor guanylyltransferase [Bacilli bacterium]|nr:molybdenum cofactor guanylyltransferase [Bacilli bacterium]PZD86176.1 molybdenum cofactor guanylyltransferase [Bacilli bacterium]PZD89291.1 molybdenum cofactor guanylyltransferase [Bacilli bacterium]RCO04792.1 molybdenum cofactor guanylyltransferase [Bacilli bacterium]RCO09404.1 molybdenum cofactor guanylyltransferase [Bacilli bacterium]
MEWGFIMKDKIIGIVLSGGQSRRFGSPKAFARKDGKYFYQYSIDALSSVVDSFVLVTNPTLIGKFLYEQEVNFAIITDKKEYEGLGPLAGIFSGMEYIRGDWYVISPIDVPFINGNIFQSLLLHRDKNIDAIIPVVSGKIQPLLSIYHYRVKRLIQLQLKSNTLSVQELLKKCRVKYVSMEEEKAFYNINRRSDYEKWIETEE